MVLCNKGESLYYMYTVRHGRIWTRTTGCGGSQGCGNKNCL